MSSIASSSTFTSSSMTSSSSQSPSPTQNNSNNPINSSNPGSFYKNLFYILIGLLAAFGLVSFLSLMRARRRRAAILREADRLGVLVPGVPGYVPIRERRMMTWTRSDGTELPDWWEVLHDEEDTEKSGQGTGHSSTRLDRYGGEIVPTQNSSNLDSLSEFQPIAVIPPAEPRTEDPVETSHLAFFPNHLAYRASSLLPPPSRYQSDQPETLNQLNGETLDVVTIVQMPRRPWTGDAENEDEKVIREWGAIELGIAKFDVESR